MQKRLVKEKTVDKEKTKMDAELKTRPPPSADKSESVAQQLSSCATDSVSGQHQMDSSK
jgi:hypothetical protein